MYTWYLWTPVGFDISTLKSPLLKLYFQCSYNVLILIFQRSLLTAYIISIKIEGKEKQSMSGYFFQR